MLLMRGATGAFAIHSDEVVHISIHAPHARSDVIPATTHCNVTNFNPRSSCEERRERLAQLLTHLLISIHAPHARSDEYQCGNARRNNISIHAPHARSDYLLPNLQAQTMNFNPRSSCEERHDGRRRVGAEDTISIHAPHARSDLVCVG